MHKGHILSGLYAITDSNLMPGDRLFSSVDAALSGGARIIQYRAKTGSLESRRYDAKKLLDICRNYQRPLIINDDIDLAKDIGADGVHLGLDDGSIAKARAKLGSKAIIGATCHGSLDIAAQAVKGGATYIAFGRFFPSTTKPFAPAAELTLLGQAKGHFDIPIVAIGGIDLSNATEVIKSGADMIATVHSLFASDNVKKRAQDFSALFESPNKPY